MPPCSSIPHGMLKFNSNLRLFSKLLVVRQAGEEIYVEENQAEVCLSGASVAVGGGGGRSLLGQREHWLSFVMWV